MLKSAVLVLTTLSVVVCQEQSLAAPAAAAWNYTLHGADWEGLCQSGLAQSPVAIPNTKWWPRLPIFWRAHPSYKNIETSQVSYGPNFIKVDYNSDSTDFLRFNGSYMYGSEPVNETYFTTGEIEIHSPSQHTYLGTHYDVEVTILHKTQNNTQARVSVLFDRVQAGNEAHPFIDDLNIVKKGEAQSNMPSALSLNDLFTEEANLMHLMYYKGSIPYPPCTENVDWFVYN
jgi:carbonic anhydrase